MLPKVDERSNLGSHVIKSGGDEIMLLENNKLKKQ